MTPHPEVFPIMLPSATSRPTSVDKFRRGGTLALVVGIPWRMIEPFEARARSNHSQSLAKLAERGGLAPVEALAVLDDKPFFGREAGYWNMDEVTANAELLRRVLSFDAARGGESGEG